MGGEESEERTIATGSRPQGPQLMSKTALTCGKCDKGWICERHPLTFHCRTISVPDPQCRAMSVVPSRAAPSENDPVGLYTVPSARRDHRGRRCGRGHLQMPPVRLPLVNRSCGPKGALGLATPARHLSAATACPSSANRTCPANAQDDQRLESRQWPTCA